MVHFFGAQYNTIFPRYMWVQLDRKRNKALEKMQLPHSLENVPFVGWGHLLSKGMEKKVWSTVPRYFNFISDRRMVTNCYSVFPGGDYPPVHSMHLRDSGPYRSTSPL